MFPPTVAQEALLEPQTNRGGELGLEYETARLRTRVSAYQIDLENEIYFSPLVPPSRLYAISLAVSASGAMK